MIGRHGAQERDLQHQVHDGTQSNGAENRKGYAAPGMARLARQVHGTLKAVVAEYDAAGRDRRENRSEVAHMLSAVHADVKIRRVKSAAHQGDRGGGRYNELEKRN